MAGQCTLVSPFYTVTESSVQSCIKCFSLNAVSVQYQVDKEEYTVRDFSKILACIVQRLQAVYISKARMSECIGEECILVRSML